MLSARSRVLASAKADNIYAGRSSLAKFGVTTSSCRRKHDGQWIARHQLFKKRYPDKVNGKGILYTDRSNARPEIKEVGKRVKAYMNKMPFEIKEYLGYEVPGSDNICDWGR
jgi:hypothetical protein